MYQYVIKRLIDFVVVFFVLIIIWPVLLLVTLWLHFANKGAGAFFLQERPGRHGKIFKVIKFKTMTDERYAEGNLLVLVRCYLNIFLYTIKNRLVGMKSVPG